MLSSPHTTQTPTPASSDVNLHRASWMAVLSKTSFAELEDKVRTLATLPQYRFLRSPEVGLVMVRGRAGGTGQPFNMGEVPLARCTVRLVEYDVVGFGFVMGRSKQHAERAALCDALLQLPEWHDTLMEQVIEPLYQLLHQYHQHQWHQTAATKVEFFTLAREVT